MLQTLTIKSEVNLRDPVIREGLCKFLMDLDVWGFVEVRILTDLSVYVGHDNYGPLPIPGLIGGGDDERN